MSQADIVTVLAADDEEFNRTVANAFERATVRAIEFGNETQKNARALGLTVKQMQMLNQLADQTGATNIAAAFTGLEEFFDLGGDKTRLYSDALQKLKLDAKELEQLSPEDRFFKLLSALENIEDKAERQAVARTLFGQQGASAALAAGEVGPGKLEDIRVRGEATAVDERSTKALENLWNELQRFNELPSKGITEFIGTRVAEPAGIALEEFNRRAETRGGFLSEEFYANDAQLRASVQRIVDVLEVAVLGKEPAE